MKDMITTEEIEKLFRMFVGADLIRREFDNPFRQNGKYIATDTHALIYAPVEMFEQVSLKLDFEAQDKPDCSKVIATKEDCSVLIDLAELESQLIPDTEDEYKEEERKCDDCEGSGSVNFVYNSRGVDGKTYRIKEDCPVCGGAGNTKRSVLTGNKIPVMGTPFKMLGVGFLYRQLKRLVDASKLAGATSITQLSSNVKGPNLFKVGDFSIIVMPALLDEPGYMEEAHYKTIKFSFEK